MKRKVERAEIIAENGYGAIFKFNESQLEEARRLPRKTKEEKRIRKEEISYLKEMRSAHREMIKFYPDGKVTEPDYKELDRLYSATAATKAEAKKIRASIRRLEAEKSMFFHSTLPYSNALKLLKERDNYTHLDDIFAMYETAKSDADKKADEERIRTEEEAKIKKADRESRLAEKTKNKK